MVMTKQLLDSFLDTRLITHHFLGTCILPIHLLSKKKKQICNYKRANNNENIIKSKNKANTQILIMRPIVAKTFPLYLPGSFFI